jgi:hypothetical protein
MLARAEPEREPSIAAPPERRFAEPDAPPTQRAIQPRRTNRCRGRSSFPRLGLHRGEIRHVVRADELHFAERKACEFAQARLIGASLRAVDVHHGLEPAQALRRGVAVRLDLGVMKISVAAMEQPIVCSPDGDAAMPP